MKLKHLFSTRNGLIKAGITLLTLSIVDALLTDFGIRNNHISEANPLMRSIYDSSIFSFYAIKIILPLILLNVITKIEPKLYIRLLVGSSLLIYTAVLSLHVWWISVISTIQ
ncbi:DUF5658 domain-containing protein [Filibacter tadaridae]|uniref:DUF5658 domain-containing protein n=1 Tax=Filibacter tadaridae TaxID=2483811 RepID=A0A3P5XI00_9BACL|nr:DUF5658 family protein [Filibacter tadaridae]VDC28119.1 hypothetical protein FILTAD_01740 [Filibacter tadaridae]